MESVGFSGLIQPPIDVQRAWPRVVANPVLSTTARGHGPHSTMMFGANIVRVYLVLDLLITL